MSTSNLSYSLFRRSPRRKQIDHYLIESENHIQSIGDTPILEQIIFQPPLNIIDHHDYLYMIYILILILFYIYYLIILLQDKTNRFVDYDQFEREIPRLLWFKKGYRFN
jgi:hypothetical protein